jgi:molybdopterin-guanine dinucleotide biosynthesis protein A
MPSAGFGGLILAGGKSKRMGSSKAHLPFGDELMLQRVVRILREVVHPIVVVGAAEQPLPPLEQDVIVARDEVSDRGPLQGLAAGLKALEGRCEAAYACSCDVPLLKPQFVLRMIDLLGNHQIVVPRVGKYYEPLAAVYRLEVLSHVSNLLGLNQRRPVSLFESVDTRTVRGDDLVDVDPQLDSLRNCNRPEDYQQALSDAGLSGS